MKKLMKRKNNKGFSLVELIVVVLIMGIIAVALAPQVMKWVGVARTNSDDNTAKDLKNAVQIALTDWQQENTIPSTGDLIYMVSKDDINLDSSCIEWSVKSGSKSLEALIREVTGEDFSTPQGGTYYEVKIEAGTGKVSVDIK